MESLRSAYYTAIDALTFTLFKPLTNNG